MKHVVRNGLDRVALLDPLLKGMRVGLATGGSAVTREMIPAVDFLAQRYKITALFNLIYGIRGEYIYGERTPLYVDTPTGLTVHSIFSRERLAPSADMLADLDVLVFDIREAGARYYEYLASAAHLMGACAAGRKPLVVLDRIAPLGGTAVEGTVCPQGMHTIVGDFQLAIRTGMTMGEFCRYVNGEYDMGCQLTVVPAEGWQRDWYYDDTDLPWVLPSPSLPDTDANLLYPGMCLIEGIETLSEGRGTAMPFKLIGAPWLDAPEAARRLNRRGLEGVKFGATYVKPVSSKFAGQVVRAVQVHIADRCSFESVRTALALIEEIQDMHPKQIVFSDCSAGHDVLTLPSQPTFTRYVDKLLADSRFTTGELSGDALLAAHAPALADYKARKARYHLY